MQSQQRAWSSLWIWAMPAGSPRGGQSCCRGPSTAELPHTHKHLSTPLLSRWLRFPAAHELLNTILMSPSTRHILHHWDMLLPVQSQRPRHGLHSCGDK